MNRSSHLLSILQGCLNPNSVQISQKQLQQYSNCQSFVEDLFALIPNQSFDILMMIMTTIKNYIAKKYNDPQQPMPENHKSFLREKIFVLFYMINNIPQAINLYKQIVRDIVAVDFEKYNSFFYEIMKHDIQTGSISATIYLSHQIARVYQWLNLKQRKPLQIFIDTLFPKLEDFIVSILSNYNQFTRILLLQLLQMFYCSFHIEIPDYLRNFQNIDKWLLYLETVLKASINQYPQNHILVSRIYVKFFSMYCRDGTDGKQFKGWGAIFRNKYALNLYTKIVQILVNPMPNEDVMSNILLCLSSITNNPDLRPLILQDHCHQIIYQHLLPFMQSSNQDYSYFKQDGLQYIRRSQDLTSHPFRRASLDLIKSITQKYSFGSKSQLIKFIEYSADVLGGNNFNDKHKEVIIITLTDLATLIMKNKYLKENFENLTQQFFIPLIKSNNNIIVAQSLNMMAQFLKLGDLSTNSVTELLALLYDKMCQENIVIKYYAVLAFTQLLDDKQALEKVRPHFQNILSIYVKLLDVIDHQGLISSLKSIVQCFSSQVVNCASDLANHLFNLFYQKHNRQAEQNDDNESTENREATAALSTIKQILESPLPEQMYFDISQKVMLLLQNLSSQFDDYYQQILNLLNTLVYKASNIINYEFPYLLCRKLLEGNNEILANCRDQGFVSIIREVEKADPEYSESLISILKNLIQKMPNQLLQMYPYPSNPQLILSMIENKKIQPFNFPTNELDQQWKLIILSYQSVVYGVGDICDSSLLKMLNGVSLFPWIQFNLSIDTVKKVLTSLEDEQADDDYYEENTMQMLVNMANDDEDDGDYYISSGGNYSYMYDSPYDVQKDQYHLIAKLKQLPNNKLNEVVEKLSVKHKNRLQQLFNSGG